MKQLLLLFVLAVCAIQVYGRLETTITLTGDDVIRAGRDEIVIYWEITNTDSFPAFLLKYGTPLETLFGKLLTTNMFEIQTAEGKQAVYTAIEKKRAEPSISDYFILEGQSSVSGEIVLTDSYHFEHNGVYDIQLRVVASTMLSNYDLVSNTIQVTVQGAFPFVSPFLENVKNVKSGDMILVDYKGCTSTRTSTVSTAIKNAVTASGNAKSYLDSSCQNSDYTTWFGTYSSSNYNTVESHFDNIYSKLNAGTFDIDCDTCTQPGTYAYVYPSDPTFTIYLCSVFWESSTNMYSYNSQPGTLTHEMSHFSSIAGTQDYQYGTVGCKNLASSNPSRAIMNADNHEYFQESKPQC